MVFSTWTRTATATVLPTALFVQLVQTANNKEDKSQHCLIMEKIEKICQFVIRTKDSINKYSITDNCYAKTRLLFVPVHDRCWNHNSWCSNGRFSRKILFTITNCYDLCLENLVDNNYFNNFQNKIRKQRFRTIYLYKVNFVYIDI